MDLTRDRMVRFVGRAWDQVKSPLYRNAFYLMMAYVVCQVLGLVVQFWRPEYVPIVVLTAIAYSFGPVLDQAAVAARRADLYFWRIVIFSTTKIPLPVVFALWLGDALLRIRVLGIYLSWSIAFGVSVLVAAFVFLPRVMPRYRPRPRFSRKRLRPMFTFSIGNWAAAVIGRARS